MKTCLLLLPFFFISINSKAQTDTVQAKISKIPYKHVDAVAKFPQGDFKIYISKSLETNHTIENSIKGQIILLMSIGEDGNITHSTVLKSLTPKIDAEVVRVIDTSPRWQPAMVNGQKTSMDMVLDIDIAINGSSKPALKPQQKPITNTPIVAQTTPQLARKETTASVRKPVPPVQKNIIGPVVKKSTPSVIIKKAPPVVKKPAPPIVTKPVPPAIKKPPLVVAKKANPPVIKKPAPPVVKPKAPVIAKKIEAPVVKKPVAVIKKMPPSVITKEEKSSIKKQERIIVKRLEPKPVKKPKRVVVKGDLFHPSANETLFPGGGLPAFYDYLRQNVSYPAVSKAARIEGKVLLNFTIEEDGSVSDVEVVSSPADDLSQEAIRVLLGMPKWIPGRQNGRAVPERFTVPINFKLAPNN